MDGRLGSGDGISSTPSNNGSAASRLGCEPCWAWLGPKVDAMGTSGWVAALAEVQGLRWVLHHRRMAFTAASAPHAAGIELGDWIVLYVARGAYHNPTRDQTQLIALAKVTSPVRSFRRRVVLAGLEFVCGCDLDFDAVLPEREGVPVKGLVDRLSFVRRKDVWGQYFRSGLIGVPAADLAVMANAVRERRREAMAGATSSFRVPGFPGGRLLPSLLRAAEQSLIVGNIISRTNLWYVQAGWTAAEACRAFHAAFPGWPDELGRQRGRLMQRRGG